MSLKYYLILIGVSTTICWLGFLFILFFINPVITGWLSFVLFYLSLFLSLVGSFSLIGFTLRFLFKKHDIVYKQMNIASRQSILLAFLVIIVLLLQSQRFLYWWSLMILVIIFSLLELFFISYKKFQT